LFGTKFLNHNYGPMVFVFDIYLLLVNSLCFIIFGTNRFIFVQED